MNLDDLKLGREALDAILSLSMKVELLGARRYRPTKSLDELVELLKTSQVADADDIRVAFERVMGFLSADQHTFFRVLGIEAQPRSVTSRSYRGQQVAETAATRTQAAAAQTYRGQKVASPASPEAPPASEEVNKEGKRKVIYRGREIWV